MTADLPAARILDVTPDAYHKLPGFSASLAKILISQSALHAKDAADRQAERLAEDDESDGEDDMPADKRERLDRGSILHALVLGIGKRVDPIPEGILASNGAISTKDAKAFVAAARAAGRIPVKEAKLEIHQQVANAIKARIGAVGHVLDGRSELAIKWWEPTPHGPVQCRCMMDHVVLSAADGLAVTPGEPPMHIKPVRATIYELKTVPSAHPEACQRTAENLGYAIAAAAYPRALNALNPSLAGRVDFRFLWCENRRPYAIWDPSLSGAFREIGERRWRRAVAAWGEGLATGHWPGYRTPQFVEMTAPMWTLRAEGYQPGDM